MSLEVQCSYKGILKKNFKKNTFYLFFLFISIMNYAQSVDIESKRFKEIKKRGSFP